MERQFVIKVSLLAGVRNVGKGGEVFKINYNDNLDLQIFFSSHFSLSFFDSVKVYNSHDEIENSIKKNFENNTGTSSNFLDQQQMFLTSLMYPLY